MTSSYSLDDFDFELPSQLIALRPASPRDSARMLFVDGRSDPDIRDGVVRDLIEAIRPGDALVFNDTRVIPARLTGKRIGRGDTEPKVEATLLSEEIEGVWQAFVKPAKKLAAGDGLLFLSLDGEEVLRAEVLEKRERGEVSLKFALSEDSFQQSLDRTGTMPLPPYIAARRAPDDVDKHDYQTVYAKEAGAVAAPTAGLHFTDDLMDAIKARGASCHFVTLHVGAGTFLPVQVEDISKHKMHSETGIVDQRTVDALIDVKRNGGRIIAVGTTSLRLLESAAVGPGELASFDGDTDIFITPGYQFKFVDLLMTNFHLPKSTLFMLVSAFAGFERMKRAYKHAVEGGYRFYSYGDACLLHLDREEG